MDLRSLDRSRKRSPKKTEDTSTKVGSIVKGELVNDMSKIVSVLAVVLLLLALVIYVVRDVRKDDSTADSQSLSETSQLATYKTIVIDDLGFSMDVPQSFGDYTLEVTDPVVTTDESSELSGNKIELSFSDHPMTFVAYSDDYANSQEEGTCGHYAFVEPFGRDVNNYSLANSDFDSFAMQAAEYGTAAGDSIIMPTPYHGESVSNSAKVAAAINLDSNKYYATASFVWQEPADSQVSYSNVEVELMKILDSIEVVE